MTRDSRADLTRWTTLLTETAKITRTERCRALVKKLTKRLLLQFQRLVNNDDAKVVGQVKHVLPQRRKGAKKSRMHCVSLGALAPLREAFEFKVTHCRREHNDDAANSEPLKAGDNLTDDP